MPKLAIAKALIVAGSCLPTPLIWLMSVLPVCLITIPAQKKKVIFSNEWLNM
jgi:hypothetical protein